MRKIIILNIVLIYSSFAFSQTKHSSIPISKRAGLQVSNVPKHVLPSFDIESALASDTCDDCGDLIGWDIPQAFNFAEQSSNELINHDDQQYLVRRLKVTAISAGGLKAYFSEFTLQPNDKI